MEKFYITNKYFEPRIKSAHHKLSAAVAAIRKLERQWERSVGWTPRSVFPYGLEDDRGNPIAWWE